MMRVAEKNTVGRRKTVRVFFAIWPNDAAQKQLAGLAKQLRLDLLCGGRKTKAENTHLTLVFVGEVNTGKVEALCRIVDGIRGPGVRAFDFVVDEIRYWKHNNIVYASTGNIPRELIDLVTALQDALAAAGFLLERRAYRPHITLMRDASCNILPELTEPIAWRVREWVLVKSEQASDGSVYIPIGRWPLT